MKKVYKLEFDAELDKIYPNIHLIKLGGSEIRNTSDCGLMPYWPWSDYIEANGNHNDGSYIMLGEYFFNNYMAWKIKDNPNPDHCDMLINAFEEIFELLVKDE